MDLWITRQTATGATVQLSPPQWRLIADHLALTSPRVALAERQALAQRLRATVATSGRPVRIPLTPAELALVQAAAEGG